MSIGASGQHFLYAIVSDDHYKFYQVKMGHDLKIWGKAKNFINEKQSRTMICNQFY